MGTLGDSVEPSCFTLRWGDGNSIDIDAITQFPPSHILRSRNPCGPSFTSGTFVLGDAKVSSFVGLLFDQFEVCSRTSISHTGDLIPTSGLWSTNGQLPAYSGGDIDATCTNVSAGELFYAYSQLPPECSTSWCSLAGLSSAQVATMGLVQADNGDTSLVIHHDALSHDNDDGGNAKLLISAPYLNNSGVEVQLFDDRAARNFSFGGQWYGSCANIEQDCHSWDTSSGFGTFSWRWVSLH